MRKALGRLGAATTIGLTLVAATKPAPKPAAPRVTQQVTGPVATYWMDAGTTTGLGAMAGGGQPSMGDIMRMMRGGSGGATHSLTLRLGTTRTATGAPQASDTLPAPPPLPLMTPRIAAAAPAPETSTEEQPTIPQRPKGRMLIYWGCGEHAGPGQPYVIDFAKLSAGDLASLPKFPFVPIHHENPPAPGRATTYGEWPYPKSRERVPASIVGNHLVRGSYTPDIPFAVPADRDFMPALALDTGVKTPAGATMLGWAPIPQATGYAASLIGAAQGARGDDATVVTWSSSNVQTFAGGGLGEYLAPAEVRRLIAARVVLPPTTTRCAIPAEVVQQVPVGLLSMNAFGEEVNLVDPPRPADPRTPWNMNWAVKVRYRSSTGTMLGMPGMGGGSSDARPGAEPAPNAPPKRGGLLGKLKTLSDAVPR